MMSGRTPADPNDPYPEPIGMDQYAASFADEVARLRDIIGRTALALGGEWDEDPIELAKMRMSEIAVYERETERQLAAGLDMLIRDGSQKRFLVEWRGGITRDVGTQEAWASSPDAVSAWFRTKWPSRHVVSIRQMASEMSEAQALRMLADADALVSAPGYLARKNGE